VKKDQLQSLGEFLRRNFTDPRRANRTFPCWSLLVFIAMALFAGRDNLAAIQRYGQFLTQAQRGLAWLWAQERHHLSESPQLHALRNLLIQIDPHQLADCLNQWLQANLGTLPRALAIDGKWIRDRALSLGPERPRDRRLRRHGIAKEKTKNDDEQSQDDFKREGEQTVALRLYETTNLENATVTGDALNNNKPQAQAVLDGGGDYFFQLKNENRHAYKAAVQKAKATPFHSHREPDTGHGRCDQRQIKVYPFEPCRPDCPERALWS